MTTDSIEYENDHLQEDDCPPRPTGGIFWNQKVWIIIKMIDLFGIENVAMNYNENASPKDTENGLVHM